MFIECCRLGSALVAGRCGGEDAAVWCVGLRIHLAHADVNASLGLIFGHWLEDVHVQPTVLVEPTESRNVICLVVAAAEELTDDRPLHSFPMGLAGFLVGPGSGEPDPCLLAVSKQVAIDETAIVARVNAA